MRFFTTLLALTAAATAAVVKRDMSTAVHLPLEVFDIASTKSNPSIVARQEPPFQTKNLRYADIYQSSSDDCTADRKMLSFDGGKYGEPEQKFCQDFDTQSVRSYTIESGTGCGAYIQEGTCETGDPQKLLELGGACAQAFTEEAAPTAQSLLVLCNAGAGDLGIPPKSLKGREEDSNAISERGEHAVSIPRADQRWVKYWLTDNDQCQTTPDDSGTIYSGNMGDNFSEQCQTRDALGGPTWVDVSDSHGCDLYIQQGDCDAAGSLPLPLSQGQCVRVSPEWEGSVWSLKAVCSG
ncbi:hypothetical protein M409DRAFT_57580 [Zasmidium cellare ATCC 36951]|uniref:Ricin B lectin domain-containing protein n=1 Tax=Zasmidium cellare ATCC 36951 TaxID=1080233 RepID=A0A6A6CBJ6_ZASCE|nr:uncharacterized protein M409DRAFT_57580 [Zasmidium cellare ATCC 36951]KAF2163292.1 hypothetical protein M409DRAFT_57580 [Zasmidium cellare ATCC 36951]